MTNAPNKEQDTAKLLQNVNIAIAVIAFIPALLCFTFTIDSLSPSQYHTDGWGANSSSNEKFLFVSSSLLLLVFYGYTFLSPRIYHLKEYSKVLSRNYWITVIVVNALTLVLFGNMGGFRLFFASSFISAFAWLPVLPLSIATHGLLLNLNILKSTSLNIKNERN